MSPSGRRWSLSVHPPPREREGGAPAPGPGICRATAVCADAFTLSLVWPGLAWPCRHFSRRRDWASGLLLEIWNCHATCAKSFCQLLYLQQTTWRALGETRSLVLHLEEVKQRMAVVRERASWLLRRSWSSSAGSGTDSRPLIPTMV